jgi:hypothetical protein
VNAASVFKTIMESYTDLLADMLAPEYSCVIADTPNEHVPDKTISIRAGILDTCPTQHELKDNLVKRLNSGKESSRSPNLCVVAMLCLASTDYSVSHESLCGITKRHMLKVWSNLERLTVSSSYQLRQWMRSRTGTRTCEGYMASWNVSRDFGHMVGNSKLDAVQWNRHIDVTQEMAYKIGGQPTSVLEAIHNDMTISGKIGAFIHR